MFDNDGYSFARRTLYGFNKGIFGQTRTLPITNDGQFHLLNATVLQFDLPGLTPSEPAEDVRYTPHIGSVLIEKVSLLIGDEKVAEQPGIFLTLYSDVMKDKRYGDVDFLERQAQGLTSFAPRIEGSTIFVPLTFWFCEEVRNSLPLFMLRQQVKLQVKFRPFSEVWQSRRYVTGSDTGLANKIKRTAPGGVPTPDADSFRIVMHCDFVVLSEANEAWFRKRNPFLIQTTETRTVAVDGTNGFPQLDLSLEEFTNPCQKLFWYLQSERNIAVNDWFNFTSRPSYDDVVSPVALVDPYVQSPGPPQSIEVSDRVVDTPALDLRVAVGPKTVNNPTSYGVGEPTCLFVGGQEAPELHLPRPVDGSAATYAFQSGDLIRFYEDRQHLVPYSGYSDGVLTVGPASPAKLHYTQLLRDGNPDLYGGNVVHTQVQLPETAVAPTEERMLVDEDLVSSTSTSFTWPYGPHQVTLFEASGVRDMQMPDTSVKDFGSLREWLELYVENNPDVDTSAFDHWDSVDAAVSMGADRSGNLALVDDLGEPLTGYDGRLQGYALGLCYLFRGREVVRLDLKHFYKGETSGMPSKNIVAQQDFLEVHFDPSVTVTTGVREFDEEFQQMERDGLTGAAWTAAALALSGRTASNVFYEESEILNGNTETEQSIWSPFNGKYDTAILRVTADGDSVSDIRLEIFRAGLRPQDPAVLFTEQDVGISEFVFADGVIYSIFKYGYGIKNASNESFTPTNVTFDPEVTDFAGTFKITAIGEDGRVTALSQGLDDMPSENAVTVSFDNVVTWTFDNAEQNWSRRARLASRAPTFDRKPMVTVNGPPVPLEEAFPGWPVPEWNRIDCVSYFRGAKGTSDRGSHLLFTNGERAVRARPSLNLDPYRVGMRVRVLEDGQWRADAQITGVIVPKARYEIDNTATRNFEEISLTNGTVPPNPDTLPDVSWTFEAVPRPEIGRSLESQWSDVGEIRNPVVINVWIARDSSLRFQGDPGRETRDSVFEKHTTVDSMYILQNGEWKPRATVPLVRGFVYQFVPVHIVQDLTLSVDMGHVRPEFLFTNLEQAPGGGGTFRSAHDIDLATFVDPNPPNAIENPNFDVKGFFHVRMHNQPTINSMLTMLHEMGEYPLRTAEEKTFWDHAEWQLREISDLQVNDGPFYDNEGQIINSWNSVLQYSSIRITSKEQVPTAYLVADEQIVDEPFPIGTEVRGLFSNGIWYDAVIFDVEEQAQRYEIRWDDGDTRERVKDLSQLVFRDGSTPVAQPPYFKYTYTGLIENHVMKLAGDNTYTGDNGGYTSYPTDQTVGFLKYAAVDTRWRESENYATGSLWDSGIHTYTSRNLDKTFGSVAGTGSSRNLSQHNLRTAVDFHLHITDPEVTELYYDLPPGALRRSAVGGTINVRNSAGFGYEHLLEECLVGTDGNRSLTSLIDKGETVTKAVVAEQVSGVVAFTGSDGVPVPAIRARYAPHLEGHLLQNDYVGRHRVRQVTSGPEATFEIPGMVIPDIAYPDIYKTLEMQSGEEIKAIYGSVGGFEGEIGDWNSFVDALVAAKVISTEVPAEVPPALAALGDASDSDEAGVPMAGSAGRTEGVVRRVIKTKLSIPLDVRMAEMTQVFEMGLMQDENEDGGSKKYSLWTMPPGVTLIPQYGRVQVYDHTGAEADVYVNYWSGTVEVYAESLEQMDLNIIDQDFDTGEFRSNAYLYASYYEYVGSFEGPLLNFPVQLLGDPSSLASSFSGTAPPALQEIAEEVFLLSEVKDTFIQDASADSNDEVTDTTVVGSLQVGTVVRLGDTYMFGQAPGDAPFEAQGVRYTLADGSEVDQATFTQRGGFAVWTATEENVPSTWTYGNKSNRFWLGSSAYHKHYDVRAHTFVPNTNPLEPHDLRQRRLDAAMVVPGFLNGAQRLYAFRGLYTITLDYVSGSSGSGVWVGEASAAQQISAVFPLVQTGSTLGLPKRVQAVTYGLDQSYALLKFAPGTETNTLWTDNTVSTTDRITMLAQDRDGGSTDVQNKIQHLMYRVSASTRNWQALETALNRNVKVMEYNHDQSWALFNSTNAYLNGAVSDIWQEVAELGGRLADAESRRDPYPYAYNSLREKWYVQNPDDLHLMREARLVRAPDDEVVQWQNWKLFYYLMNYRDGSYLRHQVYHYVFTTRSMGASSEGSAKRDAEDFKSAKLTLSLRLNEDKVDLAANRCRLFVFLQVFQTLRITPDGGVSKACEYDAVTGTWNCGGEGVGGVVGGGGRAENAQRGMLKAATQTAAAAPRLSQASVRNNEPQWRPKIAPVPSEPWKTKSIPPPELVSSAAWTMQGASNSRQETLGEAQRQQNEFMRRYRSQQQTNVGNMFRR